MFDIDKARRKGMDEKSIEIMQRINENEAHRESCAGHDFDRYNFGKFRCKSCGYETDANYVRGYQDGLKHCGGGSE